MNFGAVEKPFLLKPVMADVGTSVEVSDLACFQTRG